MEVWNVPPVIALLIGVRQTSQVRNGGDTKIARKTDVEGDDDIDSE